MHDDLGLDDGTIAACLEAHYGVLVASLTFPKVRFGPVYEPGLLVP